MPTRFDIIKSRLCNRRTMRFWKKATERAPQSDLEALRDLRSNAYVLNRQLNRFLNLAEGRLALPMLGSNAMNIPARSDWSWRPELWRGPIEGGGVAGVKNRTYFGTEAAIYHDCPLAEITLHQLRNKGTRDLAPFGVNLDVLGFKGSYLSLVINLPKEAGQELLKRHVLRVETFVKPDRPIEMYSRLNIENGPNNTQTTSQFEDLDGSFTAEFDLGFSDINEKRIGKLWLELFFDAPAMSHITIRDLTVSRRLRAEI